MSQLRERINFLKTFVSDKNVGAIAASSRFVAEDIVRHMPASARTVIECGPGEGVITRAILERLSSKGRFLAIEANKGFVSLLRDMRDSRLRIVEGRAQDIIAHAKRDGIGEADFIVASIPFSFLKQSERFEIVRDAHNLLAPKGKFIIFNYSPLMYRAIRGIFGNALLSLEVRNFPPLFIMIGRK